MVYKLYLNKAIYRFKNKKRLINEQQCTSSLESKTIRVRQNRQSAIAEMSEIIKFEFGDRKGETKKDVRDIIRTNLYTHIIEIGV